jgi:hypothetical protein
MDRLIHQAVAAVLVLLVELALALNRVLVALAQPGHQTA